jgi:hypothetical protein
MRLTRALLDKSRLHIGTERVEVGQIDKRLRQHLAVLFDHSDAACALHDKDASFAVVTPTGS